MTKTFMLFHVNLAYSAIAESSRQEVIEKCYFPMLQLIKDTNIPVGIELTGWTLQQILQISPGWVKELKNLLDNNQCELIGSGYTQMIGPLVPYEVNVWNQKLGLETYQTILNTTPKLALVNEMAYSTGMIEVYQNAGYQGIIMDRDNVRLALGLKNEGYESVPSHAQGLNGTSLPVLWSDSLLFQKLQRYSHGDSRLIDYTNFFKKRASSAKRPLAIYCNDAEIFDYRPGRFAEERAAHAEGEWKRLNRLLTTLTEQEKAAWLSPSDALQESLRVVPNETKVLSSIYQPIPVKKQAKYNISRWAVTGQDDLWINTCCHKIAKSISGSSNAKDWRRLCELWASDLRTHIKPERWQEACEDVNAFMSELGLNAHQKISKIYIEDHSNFEVSEDEEEILLTIKSSCMQVVFNLRRGLAVQSLGFASQGFESLIGTISHGYFDSIKYGADFYTGGVVAELPTEQRRITDLERVKPTIKYTDKGLEVSAVIETAKGKMIKTYELFNDKEEINYEVAFPDWHDFKGILRAGIMTFLPGAFNGELTLHTVNGGSNFEEFVIDKQCEHTHPGSTLVSCSTGFGSTTGEIIIGDKTHKLSLSWGPETCAVFPMLINQEVDNSFLCRLFFSLAELDESSKSRKHLPSFSMTFSPALLAPDMNTKYTVQRSTVKLTD